MTGRGKKGRKNGSGNETRYRFAVERKRTLIPKERQRKWGKRLAVGETGPRKGKEGPPVLQKKWTASGREK